MGETDDGGQIGIVVIHIKPEGKSRVVDMTPEMARAANVSEGSLFVLSFKGGDVTAEILPPPDERLRDEVRQVAAEFSDVFAGMKRRPRVLRVAAAVAVSLPSQLPTGDVWGFTFRPTPGARSRILLTHSPTPF